MLNSQRNLTALELLFLKVTVNRKSVILFIGFRWALHPTTQQCPACFLNETPLTKYLWVPGTTLFSLLLPQPPLSCPVTETTASPSRRDGQHCHWQSSSPHMPRQEGCLLQSAKGNCFVVETLKEVPMGTHQTVRQQSVLGLQINKRFCSY